MSFDRPLLEKSAAMVHSRSKEFVEHFYAEFFKSNPELARTFRNTELTKQKEKLWEGVQRILSLVDDPSELQRYLVDLGVRHICYEVKEEHYRDAEEKLLIAVKRVHGEAWNEHYEQLWRDLLTLIVGKMLEGSRQLTEEKTA